MTYWWNLISSRSIAFPFAARPCASKRTRSLRPSLHSGMPLKESAKQVMKTTTNSTIGLAFRPPSHSLGNIEMEKLHTSNMCASSMHQQHQNGWADHCYWPECWHSPLHQGIPTQQETTLCLEVKILLFARIVSIIIPLSANVQTRPTIMILESLALTMLQTSGMSPVDYHRAHCKTCLILLILDAFHSPWDCIRDSHWRADSYLHSVCICFDELAKNLGFCVLRISKVHHLIKQFILQWTASKQIFKWQWCWHRTETIFWYKSLLLEHQFQCEFPKDKDAYHNNKIVT